MQILLFRFYMLSFVWRALVELESLTKLRLENRHRLDLLRAPSTGIRSHPADSWTSPHTQQTTSSDPLNFKTKTSPSMASFTAQSTNAIPFHQKRLSCITFAINGHSNALLIDCSKIIEFIKSSFILARTLDGSRLSTEPVLFTISIKCVETFFRTSRKKAAIENVCIQTAVTSRVVWNSAFSASFHAGGTLFQFGIIN